MRTLLAILFFCAPVKADVLTSWGYFDLSTYAAISQINDWFEGTGYRDGRKQTVRIEFRLGAAAPGALAQGGPTRYKNGMPDAGLVALSPTWSTYPFKTRFDIAKHEVMHCLGFGIMWQQLGLKQGSRYVGQWGVSTFNWEFGFNVGHIDLETVEGYHYQDNTAIRFQNGQPFMDALMTGSLSPNARHSLTLFGCMADLGYAVKVPEPTLNIDPWTLEIDWYGPSILYESEDLINWQRVHVRWDQSPFIARPNRYVRLHMPIFPQST